MALAVTPEAFVSVPMLCWLLAVEHLLEVFDRKADALAQLLQVRAMAPYAFVPFPQLVQREHLCIVVGFTD